MDTSGYLTSQGWKGPKHAFKAGGLVHPIIAAKKRDNAGIGKNPVGNNWWNQMFDDQLKSLGVSKSNGITFIPGDIKQLEEPVTHPLYSRFVKGKTLKGTIKVKHEKSLEDVPRKKSKSQIK